MSDRVILLDKGGILKVGMPDEVIDYYNALVAVKENVIWHDERAGTVYRRSAPAQPGFGPALTSTFAHVALEHLCAPLNPS